MIAFLDATALFYLVDGEAPWAEATQATLHQLAVEAPDLALATAAGGDQACLDCFEALFAQPDLLVVMRTTLELPDPLFARLKARAVSERLTLKQLLRSYVEEGLSATPSCSG